MKKLNFKSLMICCLCFAGISCSNHSAQVKLTPVQADGLWGYENSKGEYVIKPQFDAVGHLEAISENDAGYVDCKFINGRVFVELNGKSGFINKRGKFEEQ